jgi:hypothetical protein
MQEPDWANTKYGNQNNAPEKDDVVWVKKKTRGRFGPLEVAQPGDYGIVIGSWMSSMGSHKVSILTADLREIATTATCVKIFSALADDETWRDIKLEWMDRTYVPVIVVKKKHKRTMRRSQPHSRWVITRNGEAILVKSLSSNSDVWLNKDKMHPDDWETLQSEEGQCCSVRVPQWLAQKSGLIGS